MMTRSHRVALGLDFGTESVRALLVDMSGREVGAATTPYRHGQITATLPGTSGALSPGVALQHPTDWIEASAAAVREALRLGAVDSQRVKSIGVDFTSCTILPCKADGTPLSEISDLKSEIHTWPKLWKHHAAQAQAQADRFNAVARQRGEAWLERFGGVISLESFFPKVLEVLEAAPHVFDAADIWIEAGDWYVWQLTGPRNDNPIPRSTSMAGYKAQWTSDTGYPSPDFLSAVDPRLRNIVAEKMPGRLLSPGQKAGELCEAMAQTLGLPHGIPVSAAIIDAHAGVPGAGVAEPSTLVMVLGTSSCLMVNSRMQKTIPGVVAVDGGILPGYIGYEAAQAAVGDALDWFRRAVNCSFDELHAAAAVIPPGAEGVLCVDWFNGCRTPFMDGSLRGAFTGLAMHHTAGHMYRALLEAIAFGLRWIVEILQEHIPCRRFVATGGLPHQPIGPLLMQIIADVLGERITIHPSKQGPALGAAILGVLAAGPDVTGFASISQAIHALAGKRREGSLIRPRREAHRAYEPVYRRYRALAEHLATK